MGKGDVEYFEGNQIVMGASCVGKSQRPEHKKSENKSNTVSSEAHSCEEVPQPRPKDIRLPLVTLTPHRLLLLPMPAAFRLPDKLPLHREYRYQQIFEFRTDNRLGSVCSITEFLEKRPQIAVKEQRWGQCSTLERDMHDPASVVLFNGSTYVKWPQDRKQWQQSNNKMGKLSERDIELTLKMTVYPKQLVLVQMEASEEAGVKINQRCYEIVHSDDIQIIVKEILQMHPQFEHFHTPFLNGIAFSHQTHTKPQKHYQQFTPHFLTQLFGLKQPASLSTVFLLYTNQPQKEINNPRSESKGKLTKYFEISNMVKESYGSIWHSRLKDMQSVIEENKFYAYLAIQFLRCIVDGLERQFLVSGRYVDKREELSDSRTRIIHQFLTLDHQVLRLIKFLLIAYFSLQRIGNDEEMQERAKRIIRCIACEVTTICDGLFVQFGFQINQKEHSIKLQGYYFSKYAQSKKSVRHLYKNPSAPHPPLINLIKNYLMLICSSIHLKQQILDNVRTDFLKEVQQYQDKMVHRVNLLFVEDFLLRLKLLQFYLFILQGKVLETQWKEVQDHLSTLQLVTNETILFYFTLCGLASTALKSNIDRTQAEEYYYFKSLQMAHKMYGDPRANRCCMPIEQQQVWQLLILQNYSALFKGSLEKKEFHYLNNISECLKEDLKSFFPQEEPLEQTAQKNLTKIIQYLPIKTLSGHFYLRSAIFQSQNEEIRSNYSQSLSSSSSSKRTNKVSYKINESEFTLKLSQHSGIVRWGHNIAAPPHILPPFKNKQVIAISSGNYHTIFLTEGGIFGWGQNHSSQLGTHNTQKVYLKETVCVKIMPINRNKDSFHISCGNEHSAVLVNGLLYMWGQTQGGILAGHGHVFDMISCGGLHTVAIREGIVYSWGRGEGGQLGHPLSVLKQKKKEETTDFFIDTPTPIKSIPSLAIKVACGDAHSLVLTSEGKVFVFGFCYQGQLGLGLTGDNETFQIFQPQEQSFFKERVIDVFAGPTFSFFKTEKQEVFSCGMNDCLQLGIDRVLKVFQKKKYLNRTIELNRKKVGEQEFSRPRKIDMFGGQFGMSLNQLECGENHCLALVNYMGQQTMLMGWGLNRHFQIEVSLPESTTPRTLDAFYSLPIKQICCGSTFSLASIGNILMTEQELERVFFDAYSNLLRL